MNDKLYTLLEKLPRQNLIHLMWDALDEMQAYNGRTRTTCICMAMGANEKVDENGKSRYSIKSIKDLKEHTKNMGL